MAVRPAAHDERSDERNLSARPVGINAGRDRRFFRPTWAEVDLRALSGNLRRLRARLSKATKLMFVVKANAYGHGAAACAKAAEVANAADWLGVSSVEEGVVLREAGVRLSVLVLGSLYPFESMLAAASYRLTPTVASLESARRLVEAARRLGRRVSCHLKIETGMGRIGMSAGAAGAVAGYLLDQPFVRVEGVYTHLACADTDPAFTREQLRRFRGALSELKKAGLDVPLRHAANSAAALRFPESRFELVRPGIAAYGCFKGFEPVLSLKSKIVFLKTVGKGATISYGARYRARRPTRVATLPIGYADGLSRRLSGRGEALIGGRRCPILGVVTMDMTMVDVSHVAGVRVGDDAVLIGAQGTERITAEELAKKIGTIPYEVLCGLSTRVPRVYAR